MNILRERRLGCGTVTAATFPLFLFLFFGTVFPWTEESPFTAACHERLAHASLQMAGYIAPPPPLSSEDRQLYDYVQFDPSPYRHNIYVLSLLIGSRWNDTRGRSTTEIWHFLEEMSDPEDSGEHCLRKPEDNGPAGKVQAVERCRDAVRRFARLAWSFSPQRGQPPDPNLRVEVPEFLLYTGNVTVSLSGFYFYAGRALHTVHDSFSHTYRSQDRMRIVEVVNGVEGFLGRHFDEARDGPRHRDAMDDCECERQMLTETLDAAVTAGAELLHLLASDPATREGDLEIFLDRWLALEIGCQLDNGYCGSPDPAAILDARCAGGCALLAGAESENPFALFFMAAVAFLLSRRRSALIVLALAAVVLVSFRARAEVSRRDDGQGWECSRGGSRTPAERSGGFVAIRAGASLWRPAIALQGAVGWAGTKWQVAYVAEWNPWLALERANAAPGAYATGIEVSLMIPMTSRTKLRFAMAQGLGVLLFAPYGHHRGEIGAWSTYRIMGLDIRLTRRFTLMFDPVDMVVLVINPVLPLLYQQWRWSVAIKIK